jgi:hypothetical protein
MCLLLAACGGGSKGPAAASSDEHISKAVRYAQRMRSNGIADFPDPNGNGKFTRVNFKEGSSLIQDAEQTCQHLLPSASQSIQSTQQQVNSEVGFAQCMRSHGVPNWPDPTNMGGEWEYNLDPSGPNGSGIDPNSPLIQASEQRCASRLQLSRSQLHLPG